MTCGYEKKKKIRMIEMEFKFRETTLFEHKNNAIRDVNFYRIISKAQGVKEVEMNNVIQIIDESGNQVSCTYEKFVEIFDKEGLGGFNM